MVRVGLMRFVRYQQRETIQRELSEQYGITLSTGQISALGRRFLVHLERLHRHRAPALRAALEADGGYPMQVDATCENGRGTLLVVMAGWRRWVLGVRKIPTESAESIRPLLEDVAGLFGMPCAAMRDLGPAVTKALNDFKSTHKLRIPILSCHFHFLADIGRDLLSEHYGTLRERLRHHGLRKGLRELARELGKKVESEIVQARAELLDWQQQVEAGHDVPDGRAGLAVVRSLAQWVLDHGADGEGHRFPFLRPHLDLYKRCSMGLRAVDAFLRSPPSDLKVRRALTKLQRILATVADDDALARTTKALDFRVRLLDRLRDALRVQKRARESDQRKTPPDPIAEVDRVREIRDVRTSLGRLIRDLRNQRPTRGPATDKRNAIDIVLDQFGRHRRSLWGHEITLPEQAGGGIRLVDRTNNELEGGFNTFKHDERRRSGRKNLAKDLEDLPAAAMLARNLRRDDYVEILCGSLESLPTALAALDELERGEAMAGSTRRHESAAAVTTDGHLGGSLPAEDRWLVRTDDMYERIYSAATSRAARSSRPA